MPLPDTDNNNAGSGDSAGNAEASNSEGRGSTTNQQSGRLPEITVRRYIPSIRVRVKFSGFWTDKDHNNIAEFEKVISFSVRGARFSN